MDEPGSKALAAPAVDTLGRDLGDHPDLAMFRRQMGDLVFGDRLAQARIRADVVLEMRRLVGLGLTRTAAHRQLAPAAGLQAVCRWMELYEADGPLALVDRRGFRPARSDDPLPHTTPRPGRGRRAVSFIKWAGGKVLMAERLLARMPREYGTYYEPMVGGGTMFLQLRPARAVLGDLNAELLCCWEVIRDDVEALCKALERHVNRYDDFVRVRAQDPDTLSPVERTARFIYLNKTCYNGLYRVNRAGRRPPQRTHCPARRASGDGYTRMRQVVPSGVSMTTTLSSSS